MLVLTVSEWGRSFTEYYCKYQDLVAEASCVQTVLEQNLHQLQIAIWILCEVNQCIRSGRNNFEWMPSQTSPHRPIRNSIHFERGDDAEVVATPLETAE